MKQNIMKATEKIKLMIRLEKGFKKLDLDELNLISKTLDKEIENKVKTFLSRREIA